MSDSDNAEYDSDVGRTDVGRKLRSQSSLSESGISAKTGRAIQCYRGDARMSLLCADVVFSRTPFTAALR